MFTIVDHSPTMPRLFLDSAFAVLLGKLCGYAKERSQMEATHTTYHVRSRSDNAPILSGMFQPLGDAFEPIPDSRSGNALRKLLEQPIIGDRLLGFTITTYLDFYLPWSKVQPAAAELTIHQAFLPGVEPPAPQRTCAYTRHTGRLPPRIQLALVSAA